MRVSVFSALSSHGAHEETPEEERDRYAHLNIEFDQLKSVISNDASDVIHCDVDLREVVL